MTDVNRVDTAHRPAVSVGATEKASATEPASVEHRSGGQEAGRLQGEDRRAEELRTAELTQRFLGVIGQAVPIEKIREQLSELTREMINARGVVWCQSERLPQAEATDSGLDSGDRENGEREAGDKVDPATEIDALLPDAWRRLGSRAQEQGRTIIETVEDDSKCTDVAIPCPGQGVLLCRLVSPSTMLPTFVALLKMAAGYFVLADSYHKQSGGLALAAQAQTRSRLIEHLFRSPDSGAALAGWCDHLASVAEGSLVMLCLSRSGRSRCRLIAKSGTTEFDSRGDVARMANRLAEESRVVGVENEDVLSSFTSFKSRTAVALANLLGVDSVLAIPVADGAGQNRGAVVVAGKHLNATQRSALDQTVRGTIPALLFRLNPSSVQEVSGKSGRLKRWLIGGLILSSFVGLMAVPVPYRFHCGLVLEPTVRRVVAAPFDGLLTSAAVKEGATVKRGQVLGMLDDRELKLERSQVLTEKVRVAKQHEVFLAKGQVADAQLSELRLQELSAQLTLLEQRLEQAQILSPIDGIVISEDLEDVEDSPVELGQPLFEIAPLKSLNAKIAVPDYHASLVSVDQETSIWVDDGLGTRVDGRLSRIAPGVEVQGAESVLLCEMEIPNGESKLRPGMDGTATIDAGNQRIGWVLFHRLINRARIYVGI